jgi:hypothetical protein
MGQLFKENLRQMILERKEDSVTHLEVIIDLMEELHLDPYDLADLIKEDRTMMQTITEDAAKMGYLKTIPEETLKFSDMLTKMRNNRK